jgi:branched-chain amino acid aminotransferase
VHPFLLHNQRIVPSATPLLMTPGQVGLLNGWGVFSTFRVIDGVLFAFERHFERMRKDANLFNVPFFTDPEELSQPLHRLVAANEAWNATLRVAVVRNRGGMFETPNPKADFDLVAFTVPLRDWGTGAKLGVVPQARHAANEFSGTKILSWSQNLTWVERATKAGFDEVVLLNEHGQVSECTSANLFFVFGDRVFTPPVKSSGCLPGVTRAVLLEKITVPGVAIAEKEISFNELAEADEILMTSSTREVLPVVEIEGVAVKGGFRIGQQLRSALNLYMKKYAEEHLYRRNLPVPTHS